jgi:SPP1 family predicted phage head-tail adaptor
MAIKLNTFINIISTISAKDAEGFVTHGDTVVASVRAYFEPKNSTERWSNMAQFSEANALFRFRKLSDATVTASMAITCESGRYEILSVEDVKQRGMYLEILARKVEGSS